MKHPLKTVRTLAATLITFGSLAGGTHAALTLTFDESSGNTVVTLTATNFTTVGLVSAGGGDNSSTFIGPLNGNVFFTGSTDISGLSNTSFVIPNFSFGTGGSDTAAFDLGATNPHFALNGIFGRLFIFTENVSNSDFVATASYSGDFLANGINASPQLITFSNGQTLSISAVPEPTSSLLLGLTSLVLVTRRRRSN